MYRSSLEENKLVGGSLSRELAVICLLCSARQGDQKNFTQVFPISGGCVPCPAMGVNYILNDYLISYQINSLDDLIMNIIDSDSLITLFRCFCYSVPPQDVTSSLTQAHCYPPAGWYCHHSPRQGWLAFLQLLPLCSPQSLPHPGHGAAGNSQSLTAGTVLRLPRNRCPQSP